MVSMNFEDAYVPLRIANWLTGLRKLEYSATRWCTILHALFVCIILTPCLMTMYYRPREFLDIKNPFEKTVRAFYFYMQIPFIGLIMVSGWRNTKMSKVYFRRLKSVDATLERLGAPDVCYKAIYHISIITLIAVVLHVMSQLYFSKDWYLIMSKMDTSLFFIWSYIYGKCVRTILVLDYIINVRFLGSRFRQANILLNKVVSVAMNNCKPLLRPTKDIFVVGQSRANRRDSKNNQFWIKRSLQILKQIHLELRNTGEILNTMFGLQILIETATLLTGTVILLFAIYQICGLTFLTIRERIQEVTILSFVCIVQCFKIIVMNYIAEDTQNEAQKTKEIIHSLDNACVDYETQLEIQQFSLQLAKCTMECSAFGFVLMNNAFIRGFFGAVTTYTVIIVQMNTLVNTQINNGTEPEDNQHVVG